MNLKRLLLWGAFVLVIILIIWGLIAANNKAKREEAGLLLPDQVVATDHIWGNENAPVTIVEYSDFQCPACKSYHYMIDKLMGEMGSTTVRLVYRHFPLSQHANAVPAAKASEAAGAQGKFFEMYEILFDRQSDWENSSDAKSIFVSYAEELKLDKDKFLTDFDLKDFEDVINKDYKSGVKANVTYTPTLFVNGKKIENPQSYDELKKIVDDTASSGTK